MKMNFVLDWIEFTYLIPEDENYSIWDSFLEDFPELDNLINEMCLMDHGMHGYSHCLQYTDDFMIWYNPKHERMGVHVVFPGHGMYKLCELFNLVGLDKFADAKVLFKLLKERHCKITRLDIAYDDFEKVITPHDYNLFMAAKRFRTHATSYSFVASQRDKGGTFYLGARGGERMIRIYDKDYESKGKIKSIRYEFELRKAWAKKVFDMVLNDVVFTFSDLLKDYFEIVEEYDNDAEGDVLRARRSRASLDAKWETLLELCAKGNFNE